MDQQFSVLTGATATKDLVLQAKLPCTAVEGADFTYTPVAPLVGELVTLTGTIGKGTPPITYSWGFGDGGTGAGQVVTHAFPLTTTMKAYTVTMTAANTCSSPVPPEKAVTITPRTIYLPLVLRSFTAAGALSQ
jgi:PKD repeat protein